MIQPHLPIRLPCYDFTPVIGSTFDSSLLTVGSLASGISDSHGVTGGVYKTDVYKRQERRVDALALRAEERRDKLR